MERTLSIKWVKGYRLAVALLFAVFIGVQLFSLGRNFGSMWIALPIIGLCAFLMIRYTIPQFMAFMKSFRQISYDDAQLYIDQNGSDEVVPFREVKHLDLISIDGIYRFELMDGTLYYCKPSAWYPFNYKKVDAELQRIRVNITKEKQKTWNEPGTNILTSQN